MQDLPEKVDSKFRYVMLVAKRAEQLIEGAHARVKTRHAKPTRVAMEEINRALVDWQLEPPASPLGDPEVSE